MTARSTPRTGDLLVSTVDDNDGWFAFTVVLLLEADQGGALGVVLNRTAALSLRAALPAWAEQVCEPSVMFSGGPVSTDGAICLARPVDSQDPPPGWRRSFGDIGLLQLDTPVELVAGAYHEVRIYAGYAGWESGQLESELAAGAWYVVPGGVDDIFTADPQRLWATVLRRQPWELAIYASWSSDPQSN